MQDQPKYKPLAESKFFADHRSARPMVDDTVPRGYLRTDLARYTGKMNGVDIDYFPFPITRADLERGRIDSIFTARPATAALATATASS